MFNPVELCVGLRYLRARRQNHFVSFISAVSMLGITVGVAALIVVLSVMNGFETELRERILGMTSHATVSSMDGRLIEWRDLRETALEHPEVVGVAPYVEGQGMLSAGSEMSGVAVRGVDPELEREVADVHRNMVAGEMQDLEDGGYGIVIGSALAFELGVDVGDKLVLMVSEGRVTPAGIVPRLRSFELVGIFEVGMYEYDRGIGLIHLADASRLYGLEGAVSGLRLRLEDMFRAPTVVREIARGLGGGFYVSDWTTRHANFFRAIRTEKTVMFVILSLIVAVAAFNIVSTLVMVVSDKRGDIAVLRTLGLPPPSVMGIFVVQGTVIGLVGTAAGVGLGVLLAMNVETVVPWIETMLGFEVLPADVYYISDLPAELHIVDVVRIALAAFGLSLVSTLYPAWRGSRTQPAEALRYE